MSVKLNEVRGLRTMTVEEREGMIASTVAHAHAMACDYNVEAQTALTILVWKGIVELREAPDRDDGPCPRHDRGTRAHVHRRGALVTRDERRRSYVERHPCPFCLASEGAPCDMRPGRYPTEDPRRHVGGSGELFHVGRFKKAAGAAIDALIARDGVRFDDESAIDEVADPGPAKPTTIMRDGRFFAKVKTATFHGVLAEHCVTCGAECVACLGAKIDEKYRASHAELIASAERHCGTCSCGVGHPL